MRRNGFWWATLTVVPAIASAQQIPGRDLLALPLGSLAEGHALALATADGFRNPASIALVAGTRARFSVSSLTTGSAEGVAGQVAAVAVLIKNDVTAGITLARASVDGIGRTQGDPVLIGNEVPYTTFVVSAIAARHSGQNISTGVALRYQYGELDVERRTAFGIDAGMVAEHLLSFDGRVGLSSFLWRPGIGSGDGAEFSGAVDGRVVGRDSLAQVRAGYSYSNAPGLSDEHYVSAMGRMGRWEARAGVARTQVVRRATSRVRLAVGLHYGRYLLGLAREESPSGLAPVYHFSFVTSVPSR